MNNIGIITGGGQLPLVIGRSLIKNNFNVKFFCIKKFANINLYKKYDYSIIELNSLSEIIKILKKNNINKIIMVGYVKRPSIKDIKFDLSTLKIIKDFALQSSGDDKLLSIISKFFKKNNFDFLNWKKICTDIFINEDYLTRKKPNKISIHNKNKGLEFFKVIGKADISQSLIIQNQIILGIEAAEGTDQLIIRCNKYKKKGDNGILLKLSKYRQSENMDVPVIGLQTVRNLKKYHYEGVYLEKNKCIIIEKEKVIEFCNLNNLFIAGIDKIDQ
tara:strand:- start:17 stop:838 length:822 start_codon:yes stop_codon:yes gene_type:complete